MNEMMKEEKEVYTALLKQISIRIDTNSISYNIARLKEFVEVVNLRIEGTNFISEYDL